MEGCFVTEFTERQMAYAQLIQSLDDYHPRYVVTQAGAPEAERMQLKIQLFMNYHQQQILRREASQVGGRPDQPARNGREGGVQHPEMARNDD